MAKKLKHLSFLKSTGIQVNNYDFKSDDSKKKKIIGNSQLVWRTSKKVGCTQASYNGTDKFKRAIVFFMNINIR